MVDIPILKAVYSVAMMVGSDDEIVRFISTTLEADNIVRFISNNLTAKYLGYSAN